jgi:hypothetical protein
LRHHTVSASRNHGFTPSINSSGDIMCRGSRKGKAMMKTSHVVKLVREKEAADMPWGIVWRGKGGGGGRG